MKDTLKAAGRSGAAFLVATLLAGTAQADLAPDFQQKLQSPDRPQEDKDRDTARRGGDVLRAMGVEAGMTVVDIGAGGGWYTEVLSAAVGPQGKVYMQVGPRARPGADERAARLGNVEVVKVDVDGMKSASVDAAVTALNMHHTPFGDGNDEAGRTYVRNIYNVLKPGAVAAFIDHTGLASIDNSRLHRMLPSDVKRVLQAEGFEIVEESNLLHNPNDDHTKTVSDPELKRSADRFLFIVRRPK
jgi:predicted methyltransferase